MKIRPLFAALGATLLLTSAAVNANAVCYNYGNRNVPAGAVAGGARFAAVVDYQPVGKSTRAAVAVCSTGVPWKLNDGTRGFMTAGHCLPKYQRAKAQVFQSTALSSPWVAGKVLGGRLGNWTTTDAYGTIPRMAGDIAFVKSVIPVGPYVFTGGPGSSSLSRIKSWTSGHLGNYQLCFSGFRSGTHCGLGKGRKTSYRAGSQNFTGMAEAVYGFGRFSQTCGEGGDSGGVVYWNTIHGPQVVGILSGSSGSKITHWSGCSMFYTPLGAVQKQFGGGPILS